MRLSSIVSHEMNEHIGSISTKRKKYLSKFAYFGSNPKTKIANLIWWVSWWYDMSGICPSKEMQSFCNMEKLLYRCNCSKTFNVQLIYSIRSEQYGITVNIDRYIYTDTSPTLSSKIYVKLIHSSITYFYEFI